MIQPIDQIFHGESLDFLKTLPENYVDLIITSPPYADNRKKTYRGVPMDQYVEWFKPYGAELFRVLKPDGSFVLNIKERAARADNRHEPEQRLHQQIFDGLHQEGPDSPRGRPSPGVAPPDKTAERHA